MDTVEELAKKRNAISNIRVNELMLGDWVKCGSDFEQVDYLESGNINGHPENWYEPIPLTAEMLEKNGFTTEWDEDIKLMVYDTIKIEIGDRYQRYKDGKMYLRRVLAPLYYVHELQHALRLCGIDKEIVL